MADISKIKLPSGSEYNLKDTQARADIAAIQGAIAGGVTFMGETTTALTDGSTAATIVINGSSITAVKGYLVVYNKKEFIYDGAAWTELGDLDALGSLAWKSEAQGSFQPAGSVSAPQISVETAGTTTIVNSITDIGTLPNLTTTVAEEVLTIGWSQGTLPVKGTDTVVKTGDASYQATSPTFTGTSGTVTVS